MASIFRQSLRGVASVLTLTAASLMVSAHQTAHYDHSSNRVGFYDLVPYWCFVCANYIAAAYGALLLFLPANSRLWQTVIALDGVFLVILCSTCSAALAVALVERNGNRHALWDPICHQVPGYCFRVFFATGMSYCAVLMYLIIHLLSLDTELKFMITEY